MTDPVDVLVLGCGYAGRAVAARARASGLRVCGTVRSAARAASLGAAGIDVVRSDTLTEALVAARVGTGTHVVVAFPPDGATEGAIAPALARARAVTFISTTGVYGGATGRVDDDTPVAAAPSASAAAFLAAEARFGAIGATTLRCPGIYGPDRGLHVRVIEGKHRIPGDGSRATSRIHVADLAALTLASREVHAETFVVGDRAPCAQIEIVRWIAETYGVPMPPFVPLDQVPESLRGDRRVDPSRALRVLDVTPVYPTYVEGMSPAATGLAVSGASAPSTSRG